MKRCPVCNSQIPDNQEVPELVPLGYHEDALALSIKRRIAAEEKLRWIPVSERLPEYSGYCMAVNKGYLPYIASYHLSGKEFVCDDGICFPSHWMPLPEAPKEVE